MESINRIRFKLALLTLIKANPIRSGLKQPAPWNALLGIMIKKFILLKIIVLVIKLDENINLNKKLTHFNYEYF